MDSVTSSVWTSVWTCLSGLRLVSPPLLAELEFVTVGQSDVQLFAALAMAAERQLCEFNA